MQKKIKVLIFDIFPVNSHALHASHYLICESKKQFLFVIGAVQLVIFDYLQVNVYYLLLIIIAVWAWCGILNWNYIKQQYDSGLIACATTHLFLSIWSHVTFGHLLQAIRLYIEHPPICRNKKSNCFTMVDRIMLF